MTTYYTLSYDNFYMSSDITTLESLDKLIAGHIALDEAREYSPLFACNYPCEYLGYELDQVDDSTYRLKLLFDDEDIREVTLHKATIY